MSMKKTLLIVGVLLMLVGGGLAVRRFVSSHASSKSAATQAAAQQPRAPRVKAPPAEEPAALPPDAPLPAPVDLDQCDRNLDLHGVVVTADGKPVAAASVSTITRPWRDHQTYNYDEFDTEVRGPATRTASDGTFALRLSRGDAVMLRVTASGFARRELPLRQAGERVRIVLDAGVRLVVTVRDATNSPLVGVPLRVSRDYEGDDTFRRDVTTDADGRGVIDGLPGGVFAYVSPGPKTRVAMESYTRVTLPASGQCDVEIVAKGECRTLSGRVLDDATGHALAGARVGLGESLRVETTSGEDGSFVLGEWGGSADDEVHALADGHARAITLAGDGRSLDLRLKPGASIFGRVVAADGAPVAGAMVSALAFRMGPHPWGFSAGHTTSSVDGRFRVDNLDGATAHTLCVSAAGRGRFARDILLSGAETDAGDVVVGDPRSIEGRVVAGESPVARAKVTLMHQDAAGAGSRGAENIDRYTDDLGRFRFHALAPGRYGLIVARDGAPGAYLPSVDVPADHDVTNLVVRTVPTRDAVVRVLDDRGEAVAGIWVMAVLKAGQPISQRTDSAGDARFALPDEDVGIRVIPGSAESRTYLEPPQRNLATNESELRFVLGVGVPTSGRLMDPDGHPIAQASVTIEQAGRETVLLRTDANGAFAATLSSAGTAVIQFDGGVLTNMGGQRQIDVDGGLRGRLADVVPGTDGLVIRCDRVTADRTLRVRVVAPDGTPVPKAQFFYCRADVPDSMDIRYSTTGDDGAVTLTGLMPSRFSVQTLMHGDWFASRSVTTLADGQEITLAYRATVAIEGVAAWPDGRVPEKAEARIYRGKDLVLSNDLDKSGAFHLLAPADEPGPFRIVVHGTENEGEFRGILDGVAAGATGLRVRLERK